MRKTSLLLVVGAVLVALCSQAVAQTPQYYNYQNVGTSSNSFPFGQAAGKEVQWLALPGEFSQPTPCPPGQNITTVYFFMTNVGSRTFTNVTIRMGQTSITTLPTGAWYTGPMQTVYSRASVSLSSTALAWMSITLDTPFPYDPTQSLVVEVTQCAATGSGMSVRQNTLTGFRRSWSSTATGCPFNWGGQDASIVNLGVDVVPAGIPGWSAQTSGVTSALYSVKAVNGQVAWAAGAGGVVLRTTNGGNTWTSVGGGAIGTADLYAITAIDANVAFATTSTTTTYLYRTTNGGTTWTEVFSQAGGFLNAIHMFDANNGIAQGDPVGGTWTIIRTTDGGATWARIATEPTQVGGEYGANNGMMVRGTSHIWFTPGTGNGFYRSTDGGATWSRVTLPASGFTAGVYFSDNLYGAVGNSGGAAARTTDGGATWSAVTVGTAGPIYGMGGAGPLDFWATRGTTIQKSDNRGATWTQDFSDAAAGTFYHTNFVQSLANAFGWAVTSAGKIFAYFNPVSSHDLGVASLSKAPGQGERPGSPSPVVDRSTVDVIEGLDDAAGEEPRGIVLQPVGGTNFASADTVRLRAIVKNFGTFTEASYQVGWQVNSVNQTPISNATPIVAGDQDTLELVWTQAVNGLHTARAWTLLAGDNNPANDTSGVLTFGVGRLPGDTLYTFIVPSQIVLGIAKMGPSNKLAMTSGGQVAGTTTADNKWIITDLYGNFIDTTRPQINPTTGQGFGFRDLAWDGRWLLTSDDARLRRIDTATFTELLPPVVTQTNPNRGIGTETPNRIWVTNFTTNPPRLYDTTGAIIRALPTPPVAPYGIATDPWTTPGKSWLWYSEPSSTTQPRRLTKADTANGALLTSYDYSSITATGSTSGGLDIVNDHPDYPGSVVGFLLIQSFPASKVIVVYLGPDSTAPQPSDVLVILQDSTTGSGSNIQRKKADRDTLFQYLNPLLPTESSHYDVAYIDTSGATLPSLTPYKKIIYVETSFDAAVSRWLGSTSRAALKAWLNSGTPSNKKSLVMVGADLGYNYSRSGSGAQDLELAQQMLKYTYRTDNGNVTSSITGVAVDPGLQLPYTTAPPGGGFWPDGCLPESGGTTLYLYTGRSPNDTVGGIGYVAPGYTSALLFLDPRYFTVSGPNTGFGKALQSLLQYAGVITDVRDPAMEIPTEFALLQNYPNPFNPATTIRYQLPVNARITLTIFNVLGQRISVLRDEIQSAGVHDVEWEAKNDFGSKVASGVYFYRLEAKPIGGGAPFTNLKKMLLLK